MGLVEHENLLVNSIAFFLDLVEENKQNVNSQFIILSQRDTIQAASSFAQRNQLPVRLQDQMLAHLCLKFRTDAEGLQQQETLDSLPKAIRSSISHYLFYSLVDKVYLFHGVSNDLLFQLVSSNHSTNFH